MKRILSGLAFTLLLCWVAPAAFADPTCVADTMSDYLADFGVSSGGAGCSIGNLTFTNFVYLSADVPASGVEVNPGAPPTPGFPDGPGFDFTGGWAANSVTPVADADISFDITAAPGTYISDIYVILGAGKVTGNAVATYDEEFCNAAGVCDDVQATPGATTQNQVINLSSSALDGDQTYLSIEKDLSLTANSGTASFSSFGNQYSLVPEPRGLSVFLGLGLVAGFVFFKRRQVVQS